MRKSFLAGLFVPFVLSAAPDWLLIRTLDGTVLEGQTTLRSIRLTIDAKPTDFRLAQILYINNGAAAFATESTRIASGLAEIQGSDRKARDRAVEDLTNIGLPVMTPLLEAYKDTDQHEPRPLYKLFGRIVPSDVDGLDRTLSLVRTSSGDVVRAQWPEGTVKLKKADGVSIGVPWSRIRSLAVRQNLVRRRSLTVYALQNCTQIEYLDTGIIVTPSSKLDSTARGFVRLSWNTDSWATDADGLTKPGAPAYKTNLVDGHPFGALVGRAGAAGDVFVLGSKASKTDLGSGRLQLAVNDNGHWQNNLGSYSVTLSVTDAYDVGDAQ